MWRCYFSESKPVFTVARWVIISHLPQLYLLSRPRMRCGADVTQSCNSANSTRYSRKTDSPVLAVFRVGPCLATSQLEVTPSHISALKKSPQKLKRKILKEELFRIFFPTVKKKARLSEELRAPKKWIRSPADTERCKSISLSEVMAVYSCWRSLWSIFQDILFWSRIINWSCHSK